MDKDLLAQTECPLLSYTSSVKRGDEIAIYAMHRAHIYFPNLGLKSEIVATALPVQPRSLPMQLRKRAFPVILGTSFLELGRLVIDPCGESHFTFHESATTRPILKESK